MTIVSGLRMGPYGITGKLGEGGMGEVYRARDGRLDRSVAIKVLPAAFTADPDRLARFEREATLPAQLHHPNNASIFGLEEPNGVRALVMELVEGDDLSAPIARGPMPLAEALPIARQIAEALEAGQAVIGGESLARTPRRRSLAGRVAGPVPQRTSTPSTPRRSRTRRRSTARG